MAITMLFRLRKMRVAPRRWSAKAGASCASERTTPFRIRKGSGPSWRRSLMTAGSPLTQPLPQGGEEHDCWGLSLFVFGDHLCEKFPLFGRPVGTIVQHVANEVVFGFVFDLASPQDFRKVLGGLSSNFRKSGDAERAQLRIYFSDFLGFEPK